MEIKQTKDYELIAELCEHVQELHASLYPEQFKAFDFEAVRAFFEKAIDQPRSVFLLLEDAGEARGYAWLEVKQYPENPFKKAYQSIYVHQISINGTYRKQGYGTQLMEAIYDLAKEQNVDRIELDYWCGNEIAKNFYDKKGFMKHREFVYKLI